jgi:hypothetical protein
MTRVGRLALISALLSSWAVPLLPLPARACSCAVPSDIEAWVDESEAAFVGTLVGNSDTGIGELGQESISTFEVEEWVKGDLGRVVEVHSASDGGGCGFEFWDQDMRIGAIIHEEAGRLRGGLCAQLDADLLLAAMTGPPVGQGATTTSVRVETTTPPLFAPGAGQDGVASSVRWVAGAAFAGFAGLLIWLTRRPPRSNEGD